jgi:hypothetical protein
VPEVAVLRGPVGAGKTTLAVHIGHQLVEAFPDGQLYARLDESATTPGMPSEVLRRFVTALGTPSAALPAGMDELATLFRSRVAGRSLLMVLDAASSESEVLPLLPGTPGCGVIVTCRTRLTGLPGARHFEVGPLTSAEAVQFLAAAIGAERLRGAERDAARLVAICDHLPLALRVVAARLAARPHWSVPYFLKRLRAADTVLDELVHGDMHVRDRIAAWYAGLTDPARRLFRRLGRLATAEFAAWVPGALLGDSTASVDEAIDLLVDMDALEVVNEADSPIRFRMSGLTHAFARECCLAEDSEVSRRQNMQRLLTA